MTYSYVCHTHPCLCRDSFMCVLGLIHVCAMDLLCVRYYRCICVTIHLYVCLYIQMSCMTLSYCAMTPLCVCLDSFIRVLRPIHVCHDPRTHAPMTMTGMRNMRCTTLMPIMRCTTVMPNMRCTTVKTGSNEWYAVECAVEYAQYALHLLCPICPAPAMPNMPCNTLTAAFVCVCRLMWVCTQQDRNALFATLLPTAFPIPPRLA